MNVFTRLLLIPGLIAVTGVQCRTAEVNNNPIEENITSTRSYESILDNPVKLTKEEVQVFLDEQPNHIAGYWFSDVLKSNDKIAALTFSGDDVLLLAVSDVTVRETIGDKEVEYEVPRGGYLWPGDKIVRGFVYNNTEKPIKCTIEGGIEFTLNQFEMVAVGVRRVVPACTVSCGNGYFSCCYYDIHGSAVCKCRPDGADASQCSAGGPGSTGCGIGRGSLQHDIP